MSKTRLKKELDNFTREQLMEVIVELYEKRKEVREYFEFFINPDSEKLYNKYIQLIVKELLRTKWGYSKARVSFIQRTIKEFMSFSPDLEYIHEIHIRTILKMLAVERGYYTTKTFFNGFDRIVEQYLTFCDRNLILDEALKRIDSEIVSGNVGRPSMRERVLSIAQTFLREHSSDIKK